MTSCQNGSCQAAEPHTHQEHTSQKVKNPLAIVDDTRPKGRLPSWLHRTLPKGGALFDTRHQIKEKRLFTVCEEAKCPNLSECYSKSTATFLILGRECTRACGFCEIDFSKQPQAPDSQEPLLVAESVKALNLKHVVVTMVARDDLPDGGAAHLVEVLKAIRQKNDQVSVEMLTSDFSGNEEALNLVLDARPEIFNHNLETVPRLSPKVRHKATFPRSLRTLEYAKRRQGQCVKSGIMLGLGETKDEVIETLKMLADAGCDIVTLGQYLQPSRKKLQVVDYIHPDTFTEYEHIGKALGIPYVYAGPFVRSSYNAGVVLKNFIISSQ